MKLQVFPFMFRFLDFCGLKVLIAAFLALLQWTDVDHGWKCWIHSLRLGQLSSAGSFSRFYFEEERSPFKLFFCFWFIQVVLFGCCSLSCNKQYAMPLGLKPVAFSECTVPVAGKEMHVLPYPLNPSQLLELGLGLFSETYDGQIPDLSPSAGSCWGFIFNIV